MLWIAAELKPEVNSGVMIGGIGSPRLLHTSRLHQQILGGD